MQYQHYGYPKSAYHGDGAIRRFGEPPIFQFLNLKDNARNHMKPLWYLETGTFHGMTSIPLPGYRLYAGVTHDLSYAFYEITFNGKTIGSGRTRKGDPDLVKVIHAAERSLAHSLR
jgi:hypothetical protein